MHKIAVLQWESLLQRGSRRCLKLSAAHEGTAWFPCCPALTWGVSVAPALQECFQGKRLWRGKALTKTSQEAAIGFVSSSVEAKCPGLLSPGPPASNITLQRSGTVAGCPGTGAASTAGTRGKQADVEAQATGTRTSCNLIWCSSSGWKHVVLKPTSLHLCGWSSDFRLDFWYPGLHVPTSHLV